MGETSISAASRAFFPVERDRVLLVGDGRLLDCRILNGALVSQRAAVGEALRGAGTSASSSRTPTPVKALAATVLQRPGYEVIDVESGEAAETLFADPAFDVDLVLSDIVLKGMSGPQFAASGDAAAGDAAARVPAQAIHAGVTGLEGARIARPHPGGAAAGSWCSSVGSQPQTASSSPSSIAVAPHTW